LATLRARQQAGEELVGARPLIQHLLDRPEEEPPGESNEAGR
jgi:hypothetical protein